MAEKNQMTGVQLMKQMLFEELGQIVRTSSKLIGSIKEEDWAFKPHPNMRSLRELVDHLVSVPSTDLLILKEHAEPDIRRLESDIAADKDKTSLAARMSAGLQEVTEYMEALDDETFLHRTTTPFYIDHPTAQAKWLIEIVTHAQHHRAQLFQYLKQLGYSVTMFDLYG